MKKELSLLEMMKDFVHLDAIVPVTYYSVMENNDVIAKISVKKKAEVTSMRTLKVNYMVAFIFQHTETTIVL